MAWTLLIRNGTVVDGSGAPGYAADVAVEGDRIVAIERRLVGEARRTIDAAGFTGAPGFIDIHSHSDLFYLGCPAAESKLRQGVTTEVVGMCSFSPAPVHPARKAVTAAWIGEIGSRLAGGGGTFGQDLGRLGAGGAPPQTRPPSAGEQQAMERLLDEALEAGAFGFSTGLVYPPSAYAATVELVALGG